MGWLEDTLNVLQEVLEWAGDEGEDRHKNTEAQNEERDKNTVKLLEDLDRAGKDIAKAGRKWYRKNQKNEWNRAKWKWKWVY